MKLHCYLTLTNNVKNSPIILYPHGGPDARDSQTLDPFVQIFASRVYAVLKVNFRGSKVMVIEPYSWI
jgi:dipeptidyl aminopeptidase/acylaminoacyl peptidase